MACPRTSAPSGCSQTSPAPSGRASAWCSSAPTARPRPRCSRSRSARSRPMRHRHRPARPARLVESILRRQQPCYSAACGRDTDVPLALLTNTVLIFTMFRSLHLLIAARGCKSGGQAARQARLAGTDAKWPGLQASAGISSSRSRQNCRTNDTTSLIRASSERDAAFGLRLLS